MKLQCAVAENDSLTNDHAFPAIRPIISHFDVSVEGGGGRKKGGKGKGWGGGGRALGTDVRTIYCSCRSSSCLYTLSTCFHPGPYKTFVLNCIGNFYSYSVSC